MFSVATSFDAIVAINIAPPYLDSIPIARGICDAAAAAGKPVLASFLPERVTEDAATYLQAHGVLNFPTPERAVAVVARMADYELQIANRQSPIANGETQAVRKSAIRNAHGGHASAIRNPPRARRDGVAAGERHSGPAVQVRGHG